ncbi:MAG: hypothetical protein APR63_00420 [Desulfuromonas sp. SDB]|nr:MAG: hypothetical protein APR63_00420 [Desulfuromonas sp. SDB]
MLWTKNYIPTQKEFPADTVIPSHQLLVKAGFIKKELSGIYSYLPLGWRVLNKIRSIIQEEMDNLGAQQILLPSLSTPDYWKQTGRWKNWENDIFKLTDRKKRELLLAPTHEEIIVNTIKSGLISYRCLPVTLYQIQTKFRDEPKPGNGLLCLRQFLMKDSYSFNRTEDDLEKSYEKHREAYLRIFSRCGLNIRIVSGSLGIDDSSFSEDFMIPSASGEDKIVYCRNCDNTANLDIATSVPKPLAFPSSPLEMVNTPVGGSVDEVSHFLNLPPQQMMKSLLWFIKQQPVFLLLAGDDELSEAKINQSLGLGRPAHADEILEITGAPGGYVGPLGIKGIKVYADLRLRKSAGLVTGANKYHYHYTGVEPERDFQVDQFLDLRKVKNNETCDLCGGTLIVERAIEVGQIGNLKEKYSIPLGMTYTDPDSFELPVLMGSYRIGLDRIIAGVVEQNHDHHGIIWPISLAPFQVIILPLDYSNPKIKKTADDLSDLLNNENIDHILDDRNDRAGVKFKDADLIGIPLRITLGEKNVSRGLVEITRRDTKETELVKINRAINNIKRYQHELWGLCSINL